MNWILKHCVLKFPRYGLNLPLLCVRCARLGPWFLWGERLASSSTPGQAPRGVSTYKNDVITARFLVALATIMAI